MLTLLYMMLLVKSINAVLEKDKIIMLKTRILTENIEKYAYLFMHSFMHLMHILHLFDPIILTSGAYLLLCRRHEARRG